MAGLLTAQHVAERWQCSAAHVRRLARRQALPALRVGVDWRFSLDAIEAYERAQTTAVAQPAAPACAGDGGGYQSAPGPTYTTGDLDGALPERWWEHPASIAASPTAGSGRAARTKKRLSARN